MGMQIAVWNGGFTSFECIFKVGLLGHVLVPFLSFWGTYTILREKAMAPHSRTVARKIPWVEEPGRLQSMGSLRVGHNWVTSLSLFTFTLWRRKWQPTPVFLPGESHGWRSLVGCSPWGRRESDTTEATWQAAAAAYCFTQWLCQFTFPPTMHKDIPFFTPWPPTLVVSRHFDDSHSKRHEAISLWFWFVDYLLQIEQGRVFSSTHFNDGVNQKQLFQNHLIPSENCFCWSDGNLDFAAY